jgi:hypothetical protein
VRTNRFVRQRPLTAALNTVFTPQSRYVALSDMIVQVQPRFSLSRFMGDLSDDAQEVVWVALLTEFKRYGFVAKAVIRKELRRQGWSRERIDTSFSEIRANLA